MELSTIREADARTIKELNHTTLLIDRLQVAEPIDHNEIEARQARSGHQLIGQERTDRSTLDRLIRPAGRQSAGRLCSRQDLGHVGPRLVIVGNDDWICLDRLRAFAVTT